jgi:hypothetical protein
LSFVDAPLVRLNFGLERQSIGDAVQPARQRLRLADGRGLARQNEKRCLEHILSVLHIAQQTAAQSENQRSMSRHQLGECVFIALMDEAIQQQPIVRRCCLGAQPMVQLP